MNKKVDDKKDLEVKDIKKKVNDKKDLEVKDKKKKKLSLKKRKK